MTDDIFINSNYSDIRLLGSGGYGSVVKVTSKKTSNTVAIKIVCYKNYDREKAVSEFEILKKLSNGPCKDNISKYMNAFEDKKNNKLYIEMEYVEGCNLKTYMKSFDPKHIKYLALHFLKLLNEIIMCVHEQNVLHLDIKCENIIVYDTMSIKLIDFGLSCEAVVNPYKVWMENNREICCTQGGGTRTMYAPETVLTNLNYKQTDIWLIAATIYNIVTGYHVWGDDESILFDNNKFKEHIIKYNIPKLNTGLKILDDIINKCLDRDYKKRLSSYTIHKKLNSCNIRKNIHSI